MNITPSLEIGLREPIVVWFPTIIAVTELTRPVMLNLKQKQTEQNPAHTELPDCLPSHSRGRSAPFTIKKFVAH